MFFKNRAGVVAEARVEFIEFARRGVVSAQFVAAWVGSGNGGGGHESDYNGGE